MESKSRLTNTPIPIPPPPIPPEFTLTESDKECSDEDDFELLIGFDPETSLRGLYEMPNSVILPISPEQQKDLFIEVGINLSAENPWKQISKQFLEDHLSTDTYEMSILKEKLKEVDDDPQLLIGYVPHLSDESKDVFIIYLDEIACKEASDIIRRMEACERRKIMKSIEKYPRPYKSMGSEAAVDSYVNVHRGNTIDVELQSVYPMRYSQATFQYRFSDDVRDGYVELLPDKKVHFENVYRKMIDRSVQSASRMITEEQQTDPTFPTNAWSQYLYELQETKADETETIASVDEKKEEEEVPLMLSRRKKSKDEVPVEEVKPTEPVVSKQVEDLLQILEFNQIDMYRNDYKFIGKGEVAKYHTPYLEEICCFALISKCKGRHVISMDWHPELSGVFVAAYGFNLKTRTIQDSSNVDVIKQAVIESNPILIWSFDDQLYPKLELESLREISCISFCPYDGNIIIGGTINGQIIIWDIKNRLEKCEADTILTPEQQKHRNEIGEYLKWSKVDDSNKIVLPAAISSINKSHDDAVTSIKWLPRNYQCASKGMLKEDRQHKTMYRHFVTTSLDGKILFWDLEWRPTPEEVAKMVIPERKVVLPEELKEESSPFKAIDKIFIPHYSLTLTHPVTSFTFNEGEFQYESVSKQLKFDLSTRYKYKVTPINKDSFNPKMVIGSSLGELSLCFWEGHDFSQGAIIDQKSMNQEIFANIHDGPIISVQRNKWMVDTFISIGGNIFAFWNDEYREGPIFWRRRNSLITGVQWSLDRPSVFFLIFENGTLEIWDLCSRIDVPSLNDSLGGHILTNVSQHKLPLARNRLLAIADYNTNIRVFVVPAAFVTAKGDEKEKFSTFIKEEIQRKSSQDQWKVEWFESNKDIVDAKKDVELQMMDELERKEKARKEIDDKRAQMADAEARRIAKKNAKKTTFDLPERLEKKWKEQNYKRLLKVIMERKKVDRELLEKQTKILKERMRYNEEKKVAIKQNISKIEDDLSTIRSRLIPVEEYRATREEMISENVDIMLQPKQLNFEQIELDALEKMKEEHEPLSPMKIPDVLKRCKMNRNIINQSLGGFNNSKFAKFRNERQQSHSRYSSTSQINDQRA